MPEEKSWLGLVADGCHNEAVHWQGISDTLSYIEKAVAERGLTDLIVDCQFPRGDSGADINFSIMQGASQEKAQELVAALDGLFKNHEYVKMTDQYGIYSWQFSTPICTSKIYLECINEQTTKTN